MDNQWDLISQSNTVYLSYILTCFLQVRYQQRQIKAAKASLNAFSTNLRLHFERYNMNVMASGSCAEGLLCSFDHEIGKGELVGHLTEENSDFDFMISKSCDFEVRSSDNPGYVRLLLKDHERHGDEFRYMDSEENDVFIKTSPFIDLGNVRYVDKLKENHGPALQVQIAKHGTVDLVFCLSQSSWPVEARDWLHRARTAGWPSRDLLQKIKDGGCHFTPMAHPHSLLPETEWRFSFSKAECILANSLSDTQKQCFIILKVLCKHIFRETDIFKSYYLKTVFLWSCEEIPTQVWKPVNLAICFFAVIDKLLICIARRKIPHYFIPENNIISHIQPTALRKIANIFQMLRRNPIKYILEWQNSHKTMFANIDLYSIKPVLHDVIHLSSLPGRSFDMDVLFKASGEQLRYYVKRGDSVIVKDILDNMEAFLERDDISSLKFYLEMHIEFLTKFPCVDVPATMSAFRIINESLSSIEDDTYNIIQSRVQSLLFRALHELPIVGEKRRSEIQLYYVIYLLLVGRYSDAYYFVDAALAEQLSLHSPLLHLNYAIVFDAALMDRYSFNSGYIYGTSPAFALYLKVKAAKLAEIPIDASYIMHVYNRITGSYRQEDESLKAANNILFMLSFMEVNEFAFSLMLLVFELFQALAGHRSNIYSNIATCIILELLNIRLRHRWVESVDLPLLARMSIRLLQDAGRNPSDQHHDIGGLLYGLARVYDTTLSLTNNSHYMYRCMLAYSATLVYYQENDETVLISYKQFLQKIGKTDVVADIDEQLDRLRRKTPQHDGNGDNVLRAGCIDRACLDFFTISDSFVFLDPADHAFLLRR